MNLPEMLAASDFSRGSNENIYIEGSEEWQEYERHFDTLCIEQQKLDNAELSAGV